MKIPTNTTIYFVSIEVTIVERQWSLLHIDILEEIFGYIHCHLDRPLVYITLQMFFSLYSLTLRRTKALHYRCDESLMRDRL